MKKIRENPSKPALSTEKTNQFVDHSATTPNTPTDSRATRAWKTVKFQVSIFFADTMDCFRLVFSREVSTPNKVNPVPVRDHLTMWDIDAKKILGHAIDFSYSEQPIANMRLADCTDVELNRIQRNIIRLKDAGGIDALNKASAHYEILANDPDNNDDDEKKFYANLSSRYGNAAKLLNTIESNAVEILKQRIGEQYEPMKETKMRNKDIDKDSQGLFETLTGSLSKEFSTDLFKSLTKQEKLDQVDIKDANGVKLPILDRAWQDLGRTNLLIEDETGAKRPLIAAPFPDNEKDVAPWKEKCVNALREFCGYNFNKDANDPINIAADKAVLEISKYYYQGMATALSAKISESNLQTLPDGNKFNIPSKTMTANVNIVLKRNSKESYTVKAEVNIRNLDNVRVGTDHLVHTLDLDSSHSYIRCNAGIDVVKKGNTWVPKQNENAYYFSSIVEVKKEEPMNAASPVVAGQSSVSRELIITSHDKATFTKNFDEDFFNELISEKSYSPEAEIEGKKIPFSKQAWRDLQGKALPSCVLVDKAGNEVVLSEMVAKKKEQKGDTTELTRKDLFEGLREFCGYDPSKDSNSSENIKADKNLFQVSQYLSQNLGNAYADAVTLHESTLQRLPDGQKFMIPPPSEKESYKYRLTSDADGNFSIQGTYFGNPSSISIGNIETGNRPLFTDPSQSSYEYGLGVNLIRDIDGNLKPQKREDGYLKFTIVEGEEPDEVF